MDVSPPVLNLQVPVRHLLAVEKNAQDPEELICEV